MAMYSIAYGRTEEHKKELQKGLHILGESFLAQICFRCLGEGQYLQIYNLGCGQGMIKSMGGCDYCDGTGLTQGYKPAPKSVLNQVLNAAKKD